MSLTVQDWSVVLTIAAIAAIAAAFLTVRANAARVEEYQSVQGRAYRARAWLFAALIVIGLPASIYLLRAAPYPENGGAGFQIVNARASQWYWELDVNTVKAGDPVEFRVSSRDVNHGFGLYDPSGRLVAQTQAMPGYVNRLRHVFPHAGTYRILCLEYCGLAHHGMVAEIKVE